MRKLFQLVGEISVTGIDLLNKQFNQVDKEARKVQKSIALLGKNMEKTGLALTKSITAPIIGLGAAMVLAADKAGKYADSMLDLKDITGLSTDSLQELEHVARVAGVDFNGLTNAITPFTRKLPQIVKESGAAYESIKKLGINIYDTDGHIRDMNQLFPEMLKKLMSVENITERNAMATIIFGRSLNDLAPVLGLTAEGFDAAVKEAHDLNLIIGEDGLQTVNDYRIEMEKLKAEFTKFTQRLSIDFIPVLKDSLIPMLRETLIPVFQNVTKTIKSVADWFVKLPQPVKETIVLLTSMAVVAGPLLMAMGKIIIATKAFTAAVLLMNGALLTNPFVLAGVAIAGFVVILKGIKTAYDDNIAAHRKWVAVTTEQAAIDKFTVGVDALTNKILGYGDALNDPQKAQELLGKDFEELTKTARELGYTIEGDMVEKMTRLQEVSHSLKGSVYNLNGELVRTTKEGNAVAKVIETIAGKSEITEKELEGLVKVKQAQLENTVDFEEQYAKKRDILNLQYQIEIKKAKETGESISIIREVYAEKATAIENERLDKIDEINNREKELKEKAASDALAIQEKNSEDIARQKDEDAARDAARIQKQHDDNIALFNTISSATQDFFNYIGQISDNNYEKESMLIDAKLEKDIDAINKSTMAKEEKEAAISALENKANAEQKKLQKEQAKRNKALALFNSIVGTATAIVNALQLAWPLNLVMAILYGALGAAQIGVIASQPLPMAKGGLVKSGSGGIQTEIGEGKEDEIVLPMKTGVAALADALMNKLSELKFPDIVPQQQFATAGGGTLTSGGSSRGGDINLHIGTLVADESGLKELERRLYKIRASEDQRKGRANYGYR